MIPPGWISSLKVSFRRYTHIHHQAEVPPFDPLAIPIKSTPPDGNRRRNSIPEAKSPHFCASFADAAIGQFHQLALAATN
jgi:hypothetical protein